MLTKTKKLITLALLTVCVFIPQKATAAETKESLTVSPSVIIVDENELGKSFEITISNNTGSKITLTPAEKLVTRDEQGKNIPSDANPAELLLEFNKETFDVEAGEEHKFQVRVKLSVQSNPGVYPAVSFKATGDRAGELGLASEILSVFLIQDFDGELSADTTVTVAAGAITVDRNFIVTGIVLNDGKKFFNPAGTIVISKDGKQVFEKQITSQIEGLLFPNEQKEFNITWLNELSGIIAFVNYLIPLLS